MAFVLIEQEGSEPFYLDKYEGTQGQWKAVMGTELWKGKDFVREGDNYPAVYVSWNDVQAFIGYLGRAKLPQRCVQRQVFSGGEPCLLLHYPPLSYKKRLADST